MDGAESTTPVRIFGIARHPNYREPSTLPAELRRTTVPDHVRRWVAAQAGSPVVRVARLPGASSTAVHRVWLASGRSLVLRRYVWRWFLEDEPDAPQREADVLRLAFAHGLLVPELVAFDPDGADVGDGVPVALMTLLPGRAVGAPDVGPLAEAAAAIHEVSAAGLAHQYFRWTDGCITTVPDGARNPALWEEALDVWDNHMPAWSPRLIHRDFHPGNVLLSRGRVTGVVDWANGCAGPWECDIATCRSNLSDWASPEHADRFTAAYCALTGRSYDPFWDIACDLEQGDDVDAAGIVRTETRLAAALAALARRPR